MDAFADQYALFCWTCNISQDLSCTYLAHRELESVIIIIIIIIITD